ncbi:hypothetical protein PHLGIDRAFT_355452 [Phlebiopsis gigantea 11061_1 CR5-6]|uniref:Uncharacterized protein n=1 Tax=Phlebiopsis gigantea (strain 11061_1 CR5-6) TaxID=745531 RepID=A0A0C3PPQ3_PHLG1|nr:hypothetical protein PHLGIDRAFT_355452 [Phlebiopsis gigantea 11061_1 CR5-6]
MSGHRVPTPPTNTPYIPSPVETKHYAYGLPSKARMIARSSADVWVQPTGPEAYLEPKELSVLGPHRLNGVWQDVIGPVMESYLLEQQVRCSLIHPLGLGVAGQPSPPAVIMVGVDRDSLSAEFGLRVVVHCRSILQENQVEDVHVIAYESQNQLFAGMYKPTITANPVAIVRELRSVFPSVTRRRRISRKPAVSSSSIPLNPANCSCSRLGTFCSLPTRKRTSSTGSAVTVEIRSGRLC